MQPIIELKDNRPKVDIENITKAIVESEEMVGVIDVVWRHKTTGKILITDYKFSNSNKDTEDILLDEQMYIYAVIYANMNNLTLDDIDIGYINIPKAEMNNPRQLKNGQLSKDKAQNVTYKKYVEYIHTKRDIRLVISSICSTEAKFFKFLSFFLHSIF